MTATVFALPATALGADATARAKVAFVDSIDLPDRMEETRVQLRQLLETAAHERGLELAAAAGPLPCGDPSCFGEFSRSVGVTDLLVARGSRTTDRDYHVELSLWEASTSDVVPAVADCTFCTGPQMAEAVAKAAGPLLDRIVAQHAAQSAQPPLPGPPAVTAPAASPASGKVESRRGRQIAGVSLMGLGAAVAGAGAFMWNLDGKGTDCVASSCRNIYRTRGEGIAFTVAGVIGIGAGLWLALDPLGGRDVALMLGPSGALVAGRF